MRLRKRNHRRNKSVNMDYECNVVAREKEIRLKVELGEEIGSANKPEVKEAIKKAEAYKRWKDQVLSEKREPSSKKVCLKQGSIKDLLKRKR